MKKMLCVMITLLLAGSVSADMVAYYNFEEGSGVVANDSSGYGNAANGDFVGTGIAWVTGKVGNSAVSFSTARNSWINCGKDTKLDITGQVSLAFWLQADAAQNGGWAMLMGKGNDHGYRICQDQSTSGITFAASGNYPGDNVFAPGVLDGQWHHVATTYVWNGTSAVSRMYIDGVMADEKPAIAYNISSNTYNLLLGSNEEYSLSPMCGSLDDVRIYNHALSQAEITALVPEPLTMSLLGLGGLTLLRRRR